MRDIGIVTKGMWQGRKSSASASASTSATSLWRRSRRWSGWPSSLRIPDNLLGRGPDIGITLALIPHDHPGLDIGRRHFPARQAFMNGPVRGKDVFVPIGLPHRRHRVRRPGLAHADGMPLDGARHLPAGDWVNLDQGDPARDLCLCAGAAAVWHSCRYHGRRGEPLGENGQARLHVRGGPGA